MTEFELIASLTKGAPREAPDLVRGAGDDCAVLSGGPVRDWLVTTDALIEGVHFRKEWTGAETLGRKALAVNLSDIAAMGGTPRFYLVSLGLPAGCQLSVVTCREIYECHREEATGRRGDPLKSMDCKRLLRRPAIGGTPRNDKKGVSQQAPVDASEIARVLYAGLHAKASEYGVILIGGDTVASPSGLVLSITVIGECPRGKAIFRSGARQGDAIFVTGTPGLSRLGLECLKSGRRGADASVFISKHNDPSPRINEGKWLASTGMVTAMIDTSDGLLADLGHIADESGVGFEVDAARVPRAKDFDNLSRSIGADPDTLALTGGEDYELLFAIAAGRIGKFESVLDKMPGRCKAARIGTILGKKEERRVLDGSGKALKFESSGFDHFEDLR